MVSILVMHEIKSKEKVVVAHLNSYTTNDDESQHLVEGVRLSRASTVAKFNPTRLLSHLSSPEVMGQLIVTVRYGHGSCQWDLYFFILSELTWN